MGSTLGCHRSIPRDPSDLSHNRKFSAACNFSNILVNQERLNINTATEEELMTLPGVTRAVARSIVEYREYIGGFKKVEDLALVSGVGATKLEQVKFEICVSSKGNSAQHSPSSLRRDLLSEQQPHHLATSVPLTPRVNINTATLAQLMSVRGLTEKMAVSIVDYRREHGPFRSVEDLVRMDGINAAFLDRIRHQVFAERSRPPSTHTNGGLTFTAKPHPSPTSLSLQSEDLDLPPGGPTQIISMRPSVEAFGGMRDGRPVFRLATWNLQGCSVEKANNPGVREVVCMTLLENRLFLIATQSLPVRNICGILVSGIEKWTDCWREISVFPCPLIASGVLWSVAPGPLPRKPWVSASSLPKCLWCILELAKHNFSLINIDTIHLAISFIHWKIHIDCSLAVYMYKHNSGTSPDTVDLFRPYSGYWMVIDSGHTHGSWWLGTYRQDPKINCHVKEVCSPSKSHIKKPCAFFFPGYSSLTNVGLCLFPTSPCFLRVLFWSSHYLIKL
ncbi:Eepd1 [Phodopus roborovskii]|uniref:Eepd1 protein n=1 Tax=Phodopus roborovskii TaxID=109678 RepID=A0AAU9ZTJ8_PHORO|nr:Eepd1 [Phodopus roborovskii]